MLSGFSHWLLFSLTLVVSCHADEVWFCWSYSMVQKSVLECLGFFFSTEAWPSEWSFIAANDGTDVRYVEGPLRSAFYDVSVRRPAQTPTANITVRRCIAHRKVERLSSVLATTTKSPLISMQTSQLVDSTVIPSHSVDDIFTLAFYVFS